VEDTVWACRVLNKDLRAGFSESTLNKVFPGIIEPFAVALAKPYEPDKHDLEGSWIIEPKLDGLRMCIVDGVPFTRNGRVINTVGHILEQLGPKLLKEYVFDGECMGEKDFDSASGDIRRKSTGTNETLVYNVFDMVRREEWESRKTQPFSRRRKELEEFVVPTANVKLTPVIHLTNPTSESLFKTRDHFMKLGFEGAMLKRADAPYCFKRSDNLLKLKDFTDSDGTVTGFQEGKGKYKGMLGALVAEFDGVETKVGSGYDDATRKRLWKIRETLVGEVIETQHQGKAVDGALRFPVFIRFRQDKS
jgi:DNA ligase-1